MARKLCWAAALLAVVSVAVVLEELWEMLWERWHELSAPRALQQLGAELWALRPLVLEPVGLEPRLRAAMPRWRLTPEELRTYEHDGVVLLRGFVQDKALLRLMQRGLAAHQQFHGAYYSRSWECNGVARAFMRQEGFVLDLFGPLLSTKDSPLVMYEAPIWGHPGRDPSVIEGAWHYDQALGMGDTPMVTLWMSVTKAPHTLEFVRGSHRVHAEITMECNRSREIGAAGARTYDNGCVARYADELSKQLGHESMFWEDLEPGDAFIFHGSLTHRGIQWPKARTALSMRLSSWPRDLPRCGSKETVFSRGGRNPMHCAHYRALPRPIQQWPKLFDLLPEGVPGWPSSWAAWLLHVTVAAASQAFVGHE